MPPIQDKILKHFVDRYPDCTFKLDAEPSVSTSSRIVLPQQKSTVKIIVKKGDIFDFIKYIKSIKPPRSSKTKLIAAMVNAANEQCIRGGGIDDKYNKKFARLQSERQKTLKIIPGTTNVRCPTGGAEITTTGSKIGPIDFIIHAVGPDCRKTTIKQQESESLLIRAYIASIEKANAHGVTHMAIPLVSTGVYKCNSKISLELAIKALQITPSTLQQAYIYIFDEEMNIDFLIDPPYNGKKNTQGEIVIQP